MKQFLLAVDQVINVFVYIPGDGWGMSDETISARAFRAHLQELLPAWPVALINGIFFWQPNHCFGAWRNEIERKHLPSFYKDFT